MYVFTRVVRCFIINYENTRTVCTDEYKIKAQKFVQAFNTE